MWASRRSREEQTSASYVDGYAYLGPAENTPSLEKCSNSVCGYEEV
jgi:hypothetical protein